MLINSTAFSQIVPDKKIDSFYCYGPTKTKEIVKQTIELQVCDSVLNDCERKATEYKRAKAQTDSVAEANKALWVNCEAQSVEKSAQVEAKTAENNILRKKMFWQNLKDGLLGTFAAVSVAGNIALGVKLILKK